MILSFSFSHRTGSPRNSLPGLCNTKPGEDEEEEEEKMRRRGEKSKERNESVDWIHYLGPAKRIYPPPCLRSFGSPYQADMSEWSSRCVSVPMSNGNDVYGSVCEGCVALQRVCAPSLLLQYASQQGPERIKKKKKKNPKEAHKQVSAH